MTVNRIYVEIPDLSSNNDDRNAPIMMDRKSKGTMSPQAHARVDEKHFEIFGPRFSKTVRESMKMFSSV